MVSFKTVFGDEGDVLEDRQFQLLLSSIAVVALGSTVLSPILETLTGPYGVSSVRIGQLIAAFSAPGIVLIPFVGVLADRYGRKPLIVFGLLIFGITGTAMALTTDFTTALVLRFFQGFGWATIFPMVITSLGDLYSGNREATAQGIQTTTFGLSQTITPPIAGLLVVVAWQYPLLIYGLSIPVGVAVWLWFEEPLSETAVEGASGDGRTGTVEQINALLGLAAKPRVFGVIVGRQIPTFTWFAVVTYNSIIVVQLLGGSPGIAGVLLAASTLAKAFGATQAGRATAYFDRRFDLLLLINLVLGVGILISGLAPSFAILGIGFVITGFGQGVSLSLYQSVITSLAPETLRGGLVSVSETFNSTTATAAPILMGAAVLLLEPMVGSAQAVRWTVAGTGIALGLIGSIALIVAFRAPAVSEQQTLD